MKTPIKYALFGLLGGTVAIGIMKLVGHQTSSPEGITIGCMIGGFIGGIVKERRGKRN